MLKKPIKINVCLDCKIMGRIIDKAISGIPRSAESIGEFCNNERGKLPDQVVQIKKDGCVCANNGEFILITPYKEEHEAPANL